MSVYIRQLYCSAKDLINLWVCFQHHLTTFVYTLIQVTASKLI